jgi:Mg-chelatase subunit ChlD
MNARTTWIATTVMVALIAAASVTVATSYRTAAAPQRPATGSVARVLCGKSSGEVISLGGGATTAGTPTTKGSNAVLLFLLDHSGSTSYDPLGGMPRLEQEKETLRRAVAAVPPGTTIGVLAFNDQQQWVVRLTAIGAATSAADRQQIVKAIDAVTAEGGTEFPPVLATAFDALRTASAASAKHVVLLSDGKSRSGSEKSYRKQVGEAVADGITLSTIAFGGDADTATMQMLAELGNGRYHYVEKPADIPTLTLLGAEPCGGTGATLAA